MSTVSFVFTAGIVPAGPGRPCDRMMVLAPASDSKYLLHDHLHHDLLAASDDLKMSRKRPTLGIANLFARPSTRTPSDASTPSASRSHSRSPSPTSSFLIDDDPFAKIDSPVSPSFDFLALDPPSPTPSAEDFIQPDAPPRSPLAPRQPLQQRHSHEHHRPPVSLRVKPSKIVRNTPSLPSLSDLARASGSSYASAISRTSASKRFPLEPWDLPEIPHIASAEPDENYGFPSPSRFAIIKGTNSVGTTSINASMEPSTIKSHSVPETPGEPATSLRWARLSEDGTSDRDGDVDSHHPVELHVEVHSWWDVVHDSKDAMVSDDDDDIEEPSESFPTISEAAWQHGQGHRADMQRGGGQREEDDQSSDDASDGYGSDGAGSGGYGGGSGSGRGRDDDDDARGRSAFSDDQDTDEGESEDSEDSEDNVPLAQRIPGALQAQKSIRIKDKAERERRRRERHAQKHPPVKTVPMPKAPQPRIAPLADDLMKRLLQVQASDSTPSASQQRVPSPGAAGQRRVPAPSLPQQQQSTVRTARSLHRPATASAQPPRHMSLEETRYNDQDGGNTRHTQDTNSAPLSRHATTATRSRKPSLSQPASQFASSAQAQPFSRNGTSAQHPRLSNVLPPQPQSRVPPQELLSPQLDAGQHRTRHSDVGRRGSHDAAEDREGPAVRTRTMSSAAAPAAPTHRVLQRARTSATAPPAPPPMPPMPTESKRHPAAMQHRVFVGDMQRFNTVEIGPQTRAKDVLDLVEAQGELRGDAAAQPGGWMVWEMAQDFGMERPLREYELPAEVYASWNSNTRLNAFMIKKTPLAAALARKAMPSSSPRCSGYVQWESKRGKWNKRWMELREHSIWLSKRDNGKDETFLCSLSNFDCYYVSRLHKAPKAFVFAVKSTDNLTLFENPADYLHVFSCDQRDGQQWMERILLARSYVLHKERTVLFSTPANPTSSSTIPQPSNTGSHKSPPLSRPAAPLVNVNTLQSPTISTSTAAKRPFQSGSLLAKTSV